VTNELSRDPITFA